MHQRETPYGAVHSKVGAASIDDPENTAPTAEVHTTFQGTHCAACFQRA